MPENKSDSALASPDFAADDAPELDDDFFDNAEVRIGDRVLREAGAGRRRGRPPAGTSAKVQQSLRLPSEVIEAYKATGAGWHGRMTDVLAGTARAPVRVPPGARALDQIVDDLADGWKRGISRLQAVDPLGQSPSIAKLVGNLEKQLASVERFRGKMNQAQKALDMAAKVAAERSEDRP